MPTVVENRFLDYTPCNFWCCLVMSPRIKRSRRFAAATAALVLPTTRQLSDAVMWSNGGDWNMKMLI